MARATPDSRRPLGLGLGLGVVAAARLSRRLALPLALALVAAAATPAAAQPRPAGATAASRQKPLPQSLPPDARRDYDAGKLLFEDGDYATALLKYQTAYDLTHDPRLLWNVAVCQKDLRHYAKAAAILERYLLEGKDVLSASDRRDAQDLLRAIAPFTVPMTLRVSEPGADVWIDDVHVGQSPLPGPVSLDMGTRRVRVRKDGFRTLEREFPVGGSAPTAVDLKLERQAGRLELHVPTYAQVFIDDKEVGRGPVVDVELPAGAHAMRVVAAHMRPLQTDVLVEDGKTRALDLAMEPESAAVAEVHVAVSCMGPDPLSQEQLAVFFDDATESALPLGVRIRREPGREVVAYVAYRVSPGRHRVYVASAKCQSSDTLVDVDEGGVADVTGELPPANGWLEATPAGSPDGWRLSAGIVESSLTFSDYENFFSGSTADVGRINPVGATLFGPMGTAGLQGRWLELLVDARFLAARATGTSPTGLSYDSTLTQWSIGVKPGFHLPLAFAALSTGIGVHIGQYFFSPDSIGSSHSGLYASGSFWAAIDAQPFCEWGLQLGGSISADSYSTGNSVDNGSVTSLWLQAIFTPNSMCERKHAGAFRIEGTTR